LEFFGAEIFYVIYNKYCIIKPPICQAKIKVFFGFFKVVELPLKDGKKNGF